MFIIDDEKLAQMSEDEVQLYADKMAERTVNKIKPYMRVITLLSMVGVTIFLSMQLMNGNTDGMFFFPPIPVRTGILIVTVISIILTLWHFVSTIRFFVNRRKRKSKN